LAECRESRRSAGVAQLVERLLAMQKVAGSSPVARSRRLDGELQLGTRTRRVTRLGRGSGVGTGPEASAFGLEEGL
jgi:hypothetical protein